MQLDKEQQRVVDCEQSTICIAGPGSGKTRVLTEKARRLVSQKQDVICLTFTRAAAQEIRDRIPGIMAGTIHSFCHSVVGWKRGLSPDDGYDELLTEFLKRGKDSFDWVLVDEFQDLTTTQLSVVLSLVGKRIFAVGDPYQSIYGYGGAMGIDAFEGLQATIPGIREFVLHNNYRSEKSVVRQLNEVYDRKLVSKGTNKNGLTAVLSRTNDAVKSVSESLKGAGIGHMIRSGSSDLSRRKEVFLGSRQIQVSTIHVSKGLEFDQVILYGWDPHLSYRYESRYRIEEERNVFYVANSRAVMEFRQVMSGDRLLENLQELVSNLEDLKYVPRGGGKMPTKIQSVWVEPDWYFTLKPYLERATAHPDKKVASTARTALGMLRLGQRQFEAGERYQASLTMPQLRLLSSLAESFGMEEASRRFGIGVR